MQILEKAVLKKCENSFLPTYARRSRFAFQCLQLQQPAAIQLHSATQSALKPEITGTSNIWLTRDSKFIRIDDIVELLALCSSFSFTVEIALGLWMLTVSYHDRMGRLY
jgi:hypothetical protein